MSVNSVLSSSHSYIPIQPANSASKKDEIVIGFLKIPVSSETKRIFLKVKKEAYRITDAVSSIFTGIRATVDCIDPEKKFFSKKMSQMLFFTTVFDFLLQPYNVILAVKDVISFFAVKDVAQKVDSLFSFIKDATTAVKDWVTLYALLQKIGFISEVTAHWVPIFNNVCFFVDFISIGKSLVSSKRMYTLLKGFEQDQAALRAQRSVNQKAKKAFEILRKIEVEKNAFASDLVFSKKALQKKVDTLSKSALSHTKKKQSESVRDTNKLLKVLAKRAKLQTGLELVSLINSVVYSTGCFMAFFPVLLIPSIVLTNLTGVVTFSIWGSKKICLTKNIIT